MNSVFKLTVIVVLVIAGAIGLAAWLKSVSPDKVEPNPDIKGERIFVRPYSHMTGNANAKVTLVEFADFQCPACAANYPFIKQVIEKYKSNPDFNFVNRNFPLSSHANAQISAQAAEAAASQGKYWEMMGLLYQRQNDWAGSINPTNIFVGYAQELSLDTDRFREEVSSSKYIDVITQDLKDGEALGVNGTPTFFINGERLGNALELDNQIQSLLNK